MYDRKLKLFREWVEAHQYVITLHAEEEMEEDGLTVYDLENAVLCGAIVERQRDMNTAEWKYRVRGPAMSGDLVELIVKEGATPKAVFITVYTL